MNLENILERIGLEGEALHMLATHPLFHHKKKSYEELREVFRKITEVYSLELEQLVEILLKFPPFAGLNHARVVQGASNVYGDEKAVKTAILKFPQFAGLNHARVVQGASNVYGDEEAVKTAILKFPQFASLNHARVVRERIRLGKYINLTERQTLTKILSHPNLANYSVTRYLAGFAIAKALAQEGFPQDAFMLRLYFSHITKSPYVPSARRKRITQVQGYTKEPPLMIAMRTSLLHRKYRD